MLDQDMFTDDKLRAGLLKPEGMEDWILAGKAIFTLESAKTGKWFSYKVTAADPGPSARGIVTLMFVSVLTGPDNGQDYQYLGLLRLVGGRWIYDHGTKSRISPTAPSARGFRYFWHKLVESDAAPEDIKVWHAGRCGMCGRKLTTPESVERGYGPECWERM